MRDIAAFRFLTTVDQMVPTILQTLEDSGRTWKDQLMEASTVNDGDVDNATVLDCIAHVVSSPWKVLRALIPPANLLGGWITFFVALFLIAAFTAIIGDLATIFSCTVGLSETVMAITVMSFGLNLPDALSGRLAAIMVRNSYGITQYNSKVKVLSFSGQDGGYRHRFGARHQPRHRFRWNRFALVHSLDRVDRSWTAVLRNESSILNHRFRRYDLYHLLNFLLRHLVCSALLDRFR